jgi:hypothetical protein
MFAVQLFRLFRLMRALRTIITQHESFSFVSNTYIAIVCEISAMIAVRLAWYIGTEVFNITVP